MSDPGTQSKFGAGYFNVSFSKSPVFLLTEDFWGPNSVEPLAEQEERDSVSLLPNELATAV